MVEKRISQMTYMVQGPKWEYKHHLNQLRCRHNDLESLRQEILIGVLSNTFNIPTPQEIIELQQYSKRKRTTMEFLSIEPTLKRYRLQRESTQKRRYYVEEYADNNLCGLNTDLQPTNTTVEMDCTIGVHITRSGGYINEWLHFT